MTTQGKRYTRDATKAGRVAVTLRLDPALKDAIDQFAEQNNKTRQDTIIGLIQGGFNEEIRYEN